MFPDQHQDCGQPLCMGMCSSMKPCLDRVSQQHQKQSSIMTIWHPEGRKEGRKEGGRKQGGKEGIREGPLVCFLVHGFLVRPRMAPSRLSLRRTSPVVASSQRLAGNCRNRMLCFAGVACLKLRFAERTIYIYIYIYFPLLTTKPFFDILFTFWLVGKHRFVVGTKYGLFSLKMVLK